MLYQCCPQSVVTAGFIYDHDENADNNHEQLYKKLHLDLPSCHGIFYLLVQTFLQLLINRYRYRCWIEPEVGLFSQIIKTYQ